MSKLSLVALLALGIVLWGCSEEYAGIEESAAPQAGETLQQVGDHIDEVEAMLAQEAVEVEFRGTTVVVPAGSVDALADAIDEAGNNGRVILAAGDHYESGSVVISTRVRIEGEPGAVLISEVSDQGWNMDPALHVKDVNNVRITGLEIRSESGVGNTGILVEDGRRTRIENNHIEGFGFAIWVYGGDNVRILDNVAIGLGTGSWWGIVVQKGIGAVVRGNESSFFWTGYFLSDKRGAAYQNEAHDNVAGMFLCTAQFNFLPSGQAVVAPEAANDWVVTDNNSYGNQNSGYQLQDGSFKNLVVQNRSDNNGAYDIWVTGPFLNPDGSILFPTTYENTIITVGEFSDYLVKKCGENNKVIGGVLVDTTVDPCP